MNYQLKVGGVDEGIAIPGNNSPLTWNNKTNGVYTIVATNTAAFCTNNMAGSQTITVNPLPTPTFTVQPGATACSATDVIYTTQPGQTNYVWSFTGSLGTDYSITSGGAGTNNTVTLKWLTAGSKTVTINYKNAGGCTATIATASTATNVTLLPTPTFTVQPGATACSSTNVTYTTQPGQLSYVWTLPGISGTDYTITSGAVSYTHLRAHETRHDLVC